MVGRAKLSGGPWNITWALLRETVDVLWVVRRNRKQLIQLRSHSLDTMSTLCSGPHISLRLGVRPTRSSTRLHHEKEGISHQEVRASQDGDMNMRFIQTHSSPSRTTAGLWQSKAPARTSMRQVRHQVKNLRTCSLSRSCSTCV